MIYVLIFYAALIAALTAVELKENRLAQRALKPMAALGFILMAVLVGALEHQYGRIIFVGLVACALGDMLLLSRNSSKLFITGMAAFAVGHFAYLTAFVSLPRDILTLADFIKSGLAIIVGGSVFSWLKPHLPQNMRVPVTVYFFIILIMVINALRLPAHGPLLFAMIGAVMFAVSDVFVGRDRFVTPSPRNALAITPLYFGAQVLIALSAQVGV